MGAKDLLLHLGITVQYRLMIHWIYNRCLYNLMLVAFSVYTVCVAHGHNEAFNCLFS